MRWVAVLVAALALATPPGASAGDAHGSAPFRASGSPIGRASAAGQLSLTPANVNGPVGAIVSDAGWQLSGVVPVFVPHQHVVLHVFRDGVSVMTRTLKVRRQGHHGVFSVSLRVGGIGRLTVRAIHFATPAQRRLVSRPFSLWLVAPGVQPGQQSYAVRILQYKLHALHYVVGVPGVYDERTQRAVLAFRKMVGLARTTQADGTVFSALAAGQGAFTVRFPSHGRHVEADLTHQVLALIDAGGAVERLYPMSSGKPSTPTVLGSFSVYRKDFGINSEGMVDSSYFITGYAIHGYADVPTYPASHGCLRLPVPEALSIYSWLQLGTPVDVYYR
jgi:peptidoglycan hydrolase-like protein with peptidoglycan-binding domain